MRTYKFKPVVVDTDSISFNKPDNSPFSEREQDLLLSELNELMPKGITFEHDGIFETIVAVGAKNYILKHCSDKSCRECGGKVKIKGSALKATKKEPRLKKLTMDICERLATDRIEEIPFLYFECAKEILDIDAKTDIRQWAFKITATKKVLAPTTSFNMKVAEALIKNNIDIVEGDKYYLFFKNVSGIRVNIREDKNGKKRTTKTKINDLEVVDHFNGDICKNTLLKKLFVTIKIFNKVLDISKYPNLGLKTNQKILQTLK